MFAVFQIFLVERIFVDVLAPKKLERMSVHFEDYDISFLTRLLRF